MTNKSIILFVVKCLSIYILLVTIATPLLKLERPCSEIVCATGNLFFPKTQWKHVVDKKDGSSSVQLALTAQMNGKNVSRVGTLDNMKNWVLMPFLLLVALLLALPFNWKRMLTTFALGMLGMWIYVIILLKWSINFGHALAAGISPEDTLFGEVFNTNVGHLTIIPLVIWAIVSFRRSDWQYLTSGKWLNSRDNS